MIIIGNKVDINGKSYEYVKELYIKLMEESLQLRNNIDDETNNNYIQKILDWIESTDFYEAPASTIYHESFKHGLLYHTLTVYNCMIDLIQINKFKDNIDISSATLCCLIHDWCKINLYKPSKRNVKNEETGKWEQIDSYKRNNFEHPFGHGTSSMFIAMKLFKLTEEEALAIRWHMGMFNVSSNEVNEYQQACEDYPLVHLLQFADQLSIVNY